MIDHKDTVLENYSSFIDEFSDHKNIQSAQIKKLPDTLDQLAELGRKVSYRTAYMAMCSQTHHDAEDILNYFVGLSVGGTVERINNEKNIFAIHSVLLAMLELIECFIAFGKYFKFEPIILESEISRELLFKQAKTVGLHIQEAKFPENWIV